MTINRDAQLDPGQVRDRRGISGGGLAVGGGLAGILGLVLFLFLGGDPSQVAGALNGQTVGDQPSNDLSQECQTGADAATRDDCRIIGYVNSIQAYWGTVVEGYRLAPGLRVQFVGSRGSGSAGLDGVKRGGGLL